MADVVHAHDKSLYKGVSLVYPNQALACVMAALSLALCTSGISQCHWDLRGMCKTFVLWSALLPRPQM